MGCPVNMAPKDTPNITHRLKNIPAFHSRAKKNAAIGKAYRYHAQCIHVDSAIANVKNVIWTKGIFLLLSEPHKKHITNKTDMVNMYGLPKSNLNIQSPANTETKINVVNHDSG
jgi:hypothetical protein